MLLTQAFEWLTMIIIIDRQKNKNINEIMYEINNMMSHKKFQLNELRARFIFRVFIVLFLSAFIGL